ncbi:helix-turn-helix domain-containing protein [Algoriphagus boritolerans]
MLKGKNISETTYAVGFSSISNFSRLFNKIVGDNPSDFKKLYLNTA